MNNNYLNLNQSINFDLAEGDQVMSFIPQVAEENTPLLMDVAGVSNIG